MKQYFLKAMKRAVGLAAAFAVVLAAAACGGGQKKTEGAGSGQTTAGGKAARKIAYLTPSMDVPFWRYVATGVENRAKEAGFEVQVLDSKDSADTQLKNAQDALTKQIDAMVISPVDSATCSAVLNAAAESKVPVVICDIGTDAGEYLSFISTDNEKGAREAGEYLAKLLNSGDEVAQISLNQARINGRLRKEGFEKAIAAAGMKQVDYRQMEKVNRQEGEMFAQDLITAYPNLKGLFVHSEDPTMGAVNAIAGAQKTDDVKIVAFDCSPEILDAIKKGQVVATAAQQPVFMGYTSVEQLEKHFKGEAVEKEIKMNTLFITGDNIESLGDELYQKVLTKE